MHTVPFEKSTFLQEGMRKESKKKAYPLFYFRCEDKLLFFFSPIQEL